MNQIWFTEPPAAAIFALADSENALAVIFTETEISP